MKLDIVSIDCPSFQDLDKDGRLSFEDYSKSVEQENLLLEAFGQCLPDAKVSMKILHYSHHQLIITNLLHAILLLYCFLL